MLGIIMQNLPQRVNKPKLAAIMHEKSQYNMMRLAHSQSALVEGHRPVKLKEQVKGTQEQVATP